MARFISFVTRVNAAVGAFAWGPAMLMLLLGTGAYFTIRLGFLQVRRFGFAMETTFFSVFRKKKKSRFGNLTPFQAVSTALGATIGTGNVAGTAGAILVGGPGALFWMWVSAFLGMATKYAEIVLAVKYRKTDSNGLHYGGPMWYIEQGLGWQFRFLAVLFCLFGGLSSFGIGNLAQSSEILGVLQNLLQIPKWVGAPLLCIFVSYFIFGGVKKIGRISEILVPLMMIFYLTAGVLILVTHWAALKGVLFLVFRSAFRGDSMGGGIFGVLTSRAVRYGVARGMFSNEAGLGSAPIVHAAAETDEPVLQGMWSIFEVFTSTFFVCTITGLCVLLSGVFAEPSTQFASMGGAASEAFSRLLPGQLGGVVLQLGLLLFALTSIFGWCYYGTTCFSYLTHGSKTFTSIYKLAFVAVILIGANGEGTLLWALSDTLNALMAIPNLTAVICLSGVVFRETSRYFLEKKSRRRSDDGVANRDIIVRNLDRCRGWRAPQSAEATGRRVSDR